MKTLDSQNHYEVLELSPGAHPEEIERAYRLAASTWSAGSLALYSLFDDNDATAVRDRIDQAYEVLSDERMRQAYDSDNFDAFPEPAAASPARQGGLASLEEEYEDMEVSLDSAPGKPLRTEGGAAETEYDGARLRRARMHRGIELVAVGDITKVTLTYLQAIEDEAFDQLPAPVYVRGFVTAYARAIGLDPDRVAKSFMPRLEAARKDTGHGRSLGRR